MDNISKYIKNATPEQKKANSIKAGKKSGEVRRNKRLLKDYLETLLEVVGEDGLNYADIITSALVMKAAKGDVSAYTTIRDTLGQKAPEQLEMSTNTIKININEKEKK